MMKKSLNYGGSFRALIYRELLLSRSSLISYFTSLPVYLGVCLLFLGSFKYGNLGNGNLYTPQETDALKNLMVPMLSVLPVLSASMMTFNCAEPTAKDDFTSWRRFRCTIPVTPVKAALAKYTLLAGEFAAGLLFSYIGSALVNAVGSDSGALSFSFIITVNTAILFISIVYQLLIMLLHSTDKAGIGILAVMIAAAGGISAFAKTDSAQTPGNMADLVSEMIKKVSAAAPVTVLLIPLIFAAGFILTAMILGRREK